MNIPGGVGDVMNRVSTYRAILIDNSTTFYKQYYFRTLNSCSGIW
jgi:hypothetical protein